MTAEIAKALLNTIIEIAVNLFEREEALFVATKIRFWDTSEQLQPGFIKANKSGTLRLFVWQMYSKALLY